MISVLLPNAMHHLTVSSARWFYTFTVLVNVKTLELNKYSKFAMSLRQTSSTVLFIYVAVFPDVGDFFISGPVSPLHESRLPSLDKHLLYKSSSHHKSKSRTSTHLRQVPRSQRKTSKCTKLTSYVQCIVAKLVIIQGSNLVAAMAAQWLKLTANAIIFVSFWQPSMAATEFDSKLQ